MKRFFRYLTIIVFLSALSLGSSFTFRHFNVLLKAQAKDPVEQFLQAQFCKSNFGSTNLPYKNIVLINLNDYIDSQNIGISSSLLNEFLYEYIYTYKNSFLPVNAIINNGQIIYTTCNKWDFTLNPYLSKNSGYGTFVVGILGKNSLANVDAINKLVTKYKFDTLYKATLDHVNIANKDIIIATNFNKCNDDCLFNLFKEHLYVKLYKDAIESRPINLTISDIKYPKNLISLQSNTVMLKITNNLDLNIPSSEYKRLYIKEISNKKIPDLYVKDWQSLHIPVVVNEKPIEANKAIDVFFKIGPYVYPKSYKGRFALYYGNKKINGTEFDVLVKVSKGDKKLGYIVGRELDYVNVRAKPDMRSKVVFKLDVGEYVIVNKVDGAWVSITSQYGDKGWVYRPLIRLER